MTFNIGFFSIEFPNSTPFVKTTTNCGSGGAGDSLKNLITNLDSRKYDCYIFSLGDEINTQTENPKHNLELYRYPNLDTIFNNNSKPFIVVPFPKFLTHPTKFPLDLIHCQLGYPGADIAALNYKRKNNVPMVLSIRGVPKINWGSKIRQLAMKIYVKYIYSLALKKSDVIVVQSKGVLEDSELIASYSDKIHIVPNGVDFKTYSKFNNKTDFHTSTLENKVEYKYNLLFVGSLVERKGIHTLIESFERVLKKFPSTSLTIVGNGPLKSYIEQVAIKRGFLNNLNLLGFISEEEELAKLYSFADLFILPSLSEGFPRVILESMAAGTPCLVSDISSNYYAIGEGEFGLIAEVKNPNDFAKKIEEFFEMDMSSRQELKNKVVKYAKKHSWDDVASQMEEIYDVLI